VNGVVRHVQLLADVALGQVAVVAHEPPGDVQQGGVKATAALFWLPLPDRRARRRNRAPGRVAVRQVAQAAPAMAVRRCTSSVRVGALLRLPADWLSLGASPAQAASRAAVGDRVMSPPVWATITSAVRCPTPGMVTSRAIPEPIVRAALRCPVLRRTGSPGASRRFRRFEVDVEEFEPEVLDSPQKAVQGRLVGSGAPKHRGIARHAHLRVIEERPHPWTRGTANGDHVGAIGYLSITHHLHREPPNRVGCLHPFRVRRPALARAGMTRIPSPGQASDETFGPSTSEPAVIGS